MKQLSGSDAVFLAMETPTIHAHTGGVTVLDPSDAPGFGFDRFLATVEERVVHIPRFGWKLQEHPLGLDRPCWVEDPGFSVRDHVRRLGVPSPGGMRELAEVVGMLFERPLDRGRPLWEIWYLEGLENGRVAMFAKTHHCLMDGVSGAGLGEVMCDLAPDAAAPLVVPAPEAAPQPPGRVELLRRTLTNAAQRPLKLVRLGRDTLSYGVGLLRSRNEDSAALPNDIPKVSFNANIGPKRGFACASVSLEDVKRVKDHFDVTVNDVLLALTGTALRRYLDQRGELPERPLVALVPVSIRNEDDTELGNQVSNMTVSWATDVEDPVERLQRIHRSASWAKEFEEAHPLNSMEALCEAFSPAAVNLAFRAFGLLGEGSPVPGNAVLSSVRATPVPLYTAGASIECMYPLSLLLPGQGLNFTAVSYRGNVDFGLTVDPELVPDPWTLADGIGEALDELLAAARPVRLARRPVPAKEELPAA